MTKNILAFGASSSKNSINRKLAAYTANNIPDVKAILLDLNNFEMPIYSIDKEKENGIPELARQFKQHIKEADGIIISFAEHNGAYTAAYKNIYDWVSRIEMNVWGNKPMFLLATSPGGRDAKGVLQLALNSYKHSNKSTIIDFSLPSFHKNFNEENGITDETLLKEFIYQINKFEEVL